MSEKKRAVRSEETQPDPPKRTGRGSREWTEEDRKNQRERMIRMNRIKHLSEVPSTVELGITFGNIQDFAKKFPVSADSPVILQRVPNLETPELRVETSFVKGKTSTTLLIRYPSEFAVISPQDKRKQK